MRFPVSCPSPSEPPCSGPQIVAKHTGRQIVATHAGPQTAATHSRCKPEQLVAGTVLLKCGQDRGAWQAMPDAISCCLCPFQQMLTRISELEALGSPLYGVPFAATSLASCHRNLSPHLKAWGIDGTGGRRPMTRVWRPRWSWPRLMPRRWIWCPWMPCVSTPSTEPTWGAAPAPAASSAGVKPDQAHSGRNIRCVTILGPADMLVLRATPTGPASWRA